MWNDSGTGGGFIPQDLLSASQSDKKPGFNLKSGRLNHLVPVSVKSIHDLPENTDTITYGAHEVAQLSVVGIVRSVQKDSINITYEIDDNTSTPLQVKMWIDPESQSTIVVVENNYAKAVGVVRWWQQKVYLQAHSVLPVDSNDEVDCHRLEVEYAKMYYEKDVFMKIMQKKHSASTSGAASGVGAQFGASVSSAYGGQPKGAFGSVSRPMSVPNSSVTRQGAFADQVYMLLKGCGDATGMNVQTMQQRLSCPLQKLKKTLEDLCGEGMLYTTVDDDHYNTTDSVGTNY